ncbi:unnamed protein product [Owenia fusiformis]|uniref:Uncharacterized protein n=1 Tax=Owenia fusiformis TaxID=6347 RepID=A0A8J1U9T7_OWEFU|nr:unnamed protein product [Owenia fusiformis]
MARIIRHRIRSFMIGLCMVTFLMVLYLGTSRNTYLGESNDVKRDVLVSSLVFEELMAQPEPATPDSNILLYNGLSTCGSNGFNENLKALSKPNGFRFIRQESRGMKLVKKPKYYIEELYTESSERPIAKYHDVFFLNFNSYNYSNPIYVNIAREPYNRAEALYSYKRRLCKKEHRFCTIYSNEMLHLTFEQCLKTWKNATYICGDFYKSTMHTFCGHNKICQDDKMPDFGVQLAKANIARHYKFVGLYEEYRTSMIALEEIIPTYFVGTSSRYRRRNEEGVTGFPDETTEKLVKEVLKYDYEVYYFIKQRFYQTIQKLGLESHLTDILWVH